MARRRLTWTPHNVDKLEKIKAVLVDLKNYLPLTLRQIYYQLVSKEYIENKTSQYNMLSNLLKWARIDGHVPWNAVEDRVRSFKNAEGWEDKEEFLELTLENYLGIYRRNLWQTQKHYVEVWIEKDALSSIFTRVCSQYGVSVVVCRGFSSVSFLHNFKKRLIAHRGKMPVMLYFGDFDPSGMEMLEAMQTTLQDELDVKYVTFQRVALQKSDIFDFALPHNPAALKTTDTRSAKHTAKYGHIAVELDALRPDDLERKIHGAITTIMDIDRYNAELRRFEAEKEEMGKLGRKMRKLVDEA